MREATIKMGGEPPSVDRVMVATDRSETADRAVRWAANVAEAYRAELLLLQVLPVADEDEGPDVDLTLADEELGRFAEKDHTDSLLGNVPHSSVWHHACGGKGIAPPSLAGGSANKEERLHVRRREQGSHPAIR